MQWQTILGMSMSKKVAPAAPESSFCESSFVSCWRWALQWEGSRCDSLCSSKFGHEGSTRGTSIGLEDGSNISAS